MARFLDSASSPKVERRIGRSEPPVAPKVQTVAEYLADWIFAVPPSQALIDGMIAAGRLTK